MLGSGWLGALVVADDSAESVDKFDFMEVNLQLIIHSNTSPYFSPRTPRLRVSKLSNSSLRRK